MATQGFHQVQKQTQSLVLAPQLRQSLKILQVPALELRNTILEELQTNPALEELPMDGVSIESSAAEADNNGTESHENGEEMKFEEDFALLSRLNDDWNDYMAEEANAHTFTSDDAERRQHFFDSLTAETSLQESLMRQAELSDAPTEVCRALEYLVGSLDDNGFFTGNLNDLALLAELPLKAFQEAHTLLKTFDPPGIGAESLQECLLTQLRQAGKGRCLAATIVRDHFKLLLRRRIPDIARRTDASTDAVHAALEEIAALDPAPGRKFGEDSNRVVVPDVKVEKDDYGEWRITLNDEYIPRLRLSSIYKELIAKGNLSRQEKEYIQDKFRSGKFLINSIAQRQQTIERIARELLECQSDFFEEGPSRLRPLTMNQVAMAVGVHETTVSRAIANKYIDTPHGVFDMKYFFTPGYQSGDGTSISNTSVKERIAKIIESENPAKPYSDQELVRILAEEGVNIARRTVAKYREELGIFATNLRRRYS